MSDDEYPVYGTLTADRRAVEDAVLVWEDGPPSVADIAKHLGMPPLRVVEMVGLSISMWLEGDCLTPETTRIQCDGE